MTKTNMDRVRNRLWLHAHQAGSHNHRYGLTAPSRMTPAEALVYMGIPNVMMVVYNDKPEPPFEQQAKPLAAAEQLVWSIVGDSRSKRNDRETDLEAVVALSPKMPNLNGAIVDDFFTTDAARWDLPAIQAIVGRLHENRLDLWIPLYADQLDARLSPFMDICDRTSLWTWRSEDLADLEAMFAKYEELSSRTLKYLGCYMYDYGAQGPIPVDRMRYQCEKGLEWLRQGRIDGIVFVASCICDLDLEAVEWTRKWIADVGDLER